MSTTIMVTGATGFVGSSLVRTLRSKNKPTLAVSRSSALLDGVPCVVVPDQSAACDWSPYLSGIQTIIHCAARVHMMHDADANPLELYRQVNLHTTLNLARQAAQAGVRQFIFLSSIKVNGEFTTLGQAYDENSAPCPVDPYGISKLEAETALLELSQHSGMAVTIIRPPLVYGPGVKANFESMLRWLHKGIPLPLGSIRNQRSLVYVGNLVDLICRCIQHPGAYNQVFLASDAHDMSTTELLQHCAAALGRPARLVSVPAAIIMLAASMAGRKQVAQRLCASLRIDSTKAQQRLQWQPPFTVAQGLQATAHAFLEQAT